MMWGCVMALCALPLMAATAPSPPACERMLTALDAWRLEEAAPLESLVRQEAEAKATAGCALVALAALHLQDGNALEGVASLQRAAALPSLDANSAARGAELQPRLAAAAALARDAHTFSSAHFWLRAHSKDEVVAPYALEVAEHALLGIGKRLGWPQKEAASAPIGIEFYPSVAELAQATGLSAQAIETSGTIAVCKEHRLLLLSPLATSSGYEWADTLAHELTHLIVGRLSRNRAPVWLQEGLAKTYEAAWRGPPGPHIARATERRMRLAARHDELIPLSRMHPSVALLPSHQQTALAFAEVSSLLDGIRRRVGDAPLGAMLAHLARDEDFDAAWRAPLFPVRKEEALWRQRIERLPLLTAHEGDDEEEEKVSLPGHEAAHAPPAASPLAESSGASGRLLRLGELLALEGRWAAAVRAYERASADSQKPDARIERALARALTEAGRPGEALALWRRAATQTPQAHDVRYWLGLLLASQNQCAEAVVHLKEFCLYNPFVADVHEAWARCAASAGESAVAAREERFAALCREPRPRRHAPLPSEAPAASP